MTCILLAASDPALLRAWETADIPEGYLAISAPTAGEAFARACSEQPSIILTGPLDIPPEQFAARIEEDARTRTIPVILVDAAPGADGAALMRTVTEAMAHKRILIAEDDRQMASLLKAVLAREGFAVTSANDGAEAIRQIRSFQPHLIVLDIQLPVIDGFHICRLISDDPSLAQRPKILIITGRASDWDQQLGAACGAEGYLVKPFSHRVFVENVRSILAGAQ